MVKGSPTIKRIDGLTYGDLDAALRRLGFAVQKRARARFYVHQESGASFLLPLFPFTEPLAAYHYVGVRGSLDHSGIIDRGNFDLMLIRHTIAGLPATA